MKRSLPFLCLPVSYVRFLSFLLDIPLVTFIGTYIEPNSIEWFMVHFLLQLLGCFQLIIQVTGKNQIPNLVQRQEFTGMGNILIGIAQIVSSGNLNYEIIWDKVGKTVGAAEFLSGLECVCLPFNTLWVSSMRRSVSSPDETTKKELKIRAAKNFWRNSRFFICWWTQF